MARMSTVDRLPPEVRELIERLRGNGRTIDEILAKLRDLDAEVSRSALGRHIKLLDARKPGDLSLAREISGLRQEIGQLRDLLMKSHGKEPRTKF